MLERVKGQILKDEEKGLMLGVEVMKKEDQMERKNVVIEKVREKIRKKNEVENVLEVYGLEIMQGGLKKSEGKMLIMIKEWKERKKKEEDERKMKRKIMGMNEGIKEGMVMELKKNKIMGIRKKGGFEIYVKERKGGGVEQMKKEKKIINEEDEKRKELKGVRKKLEKYVKKYEIKIEREKEKEMGVKINQVLKEMKEKFGRIYVNELKIYGRKYKVKMKQEEELRRDKGDIKNVLVRED